MNNVLNLCLIWVKFVFWGFIFGGPCLSVLQLVLPSLFIVTTWDLIRILQSSVSHTPYFWGEIGRQTMSLSDAATLLQQRGD